jgi:hypothetical protein
MVAPKGAISMSTDEIRSLDSNSISNSIEHFLIVENNNID